ncbi:MAG: M20/M25/M40 family metallo-hydrolase [Anaerolineales bacterium]
MTIKVEEYHPPLIGEAQIKLLERLSNACAVSGEEGEVRKIVLDEIKPHVDEVKIDALGNVLATKRGTQEQPMQVMLAAHMDEVGLMLTYDNGEGIYRFEVVGGIAVSDLAGKAVWIGKEHIPGVIGLKPLHLGHGDNPKKPLDLEDLHIDVGPAKGKEKVGDRAVFAMSFMQLGPSLLGKAMDNRLGVATLIELVKHAPANIDLQAAFTVQEEIGLRGARVAAYAFNPDLAIILDSTPAYDLPAWDIEENVRYNTRLGAGPAIYVADSSTISDPRLVRFMIKTAEEHKIPYQLRQPGGGGTDAGTIHKQRAGIPSVSVSVPGRYHHSPASIIRVSDWQMTVNLVGLVLSSLTPELLAIER